jgi:hypothetical protein
MFNPMSLLARRSSISCLLLGATVAWLGACSSDTPDPDAHD